MSLILLLSLLFTATPLAAQDFQTYFTDCTLRLDYIFAGNADHQVIALDEMCNIPRWYGKRNRLAEVPMEGNGQVIVRSKRTGEVIFRNSFSTLFQEWLTYDEAKTTTRSFENVFLIPMPKDTVNVTVRLYNNRREVTTEMVHTVVPTDILIRNIGNKDVTPYEVLLAPAETARCINVAFVAEGYTEAEMETFLSDARIATDAIFQHEPFKAQKDRFRVTAVKAVSEESGTSIPSKGVWKKTALSSHFDTFYSERYLTTLHLKDLHNVLAGTPYEHIIVLVNTEHYGGGGILNSYNLAMTHHRSFQPVVVHEFGHSFAGLADEYAYEWEDIAMYPHDVEPWEANITTKKDFASKWQDMVGGDIGLHEGAGYSMKGVWRPCDNCRMRTNEHPEFCPVCQRAIRRVVDFYTAK